MSKAKPGLALNWIDGAWVAASDVRQSINPATYEVIGEYADGGLEAAHKSVEAAKRAFRETTWAVDHELRARVLWQIADAFERNRNALLDLLATENGKVKGEAAFEVDMAPSKLRYYAAAALVESGRAVTPKPGSISLILRQPMGVAGIIAPWNSPVVLTIRSLAPALAAGCTAVIKLPGQVAQVAHFMANIMAEAADLPKGVINLFFESGRAIGAVGANYMKRFGLELGGKTPMIPFDDADIDAAVPALEKALTVFAGQFCMTGSRLLVQRGIADKVRDGLAERLRAVKVGPASDPMSDMGPLIDKANVARVEKVVEAAIADGAKAIVRGGPITEGPLEKGGIFQACAARGERPKAADRATGNLRAGADPAGVRRRARSGHPGK
jgi:betaine-aldehyde dehydrogenase